MSLKPKTVRLRYYRSVYGITARTVKKLGGIEYLDNLNQDSRLIIINQHKIYKHTNAYTKSQNKLNTERCRRTSKQRFSYRIRSLLQAREIANLTERITGDRTGIIKINDRHYRVVRYSGDKQSFV